MHLTQMQNVLQLEQAWVCLENTILFNTATTFQLGRLCYLLVSSVCEDKLAVLLQTGRRGGVYLASFGVPFLSLLG